MDDRMAKAKSAGGLLCLVGCILLLLHVPLFIKGGPLPPLLFVNLAASGAVLALGLVTRVKCSSLPLRLGLGVFLMHQLAGLLLRATAAKTFDYLFLAAAIYVVWSQWNALRPPQRVVQ